MSYQINVNQTSTIAGITFNSNRTLTAEGTAGFNLDVQPAKIGQLTTRTDAATGTLTMASGHGIPTAAKLDIYWDGGSRRGVTVGTVSGLSVPFSVGSGDNLPANLTAITAMVPIVQPLVAPFATAKALAAQSGIDGTVVFCEDDGTPIVAYTLTAGQGTEWDSDSGIDNPLDADVGEVHLSHKDSVNIGNMYGVVMYD